jgi:hypothetical protein
VQNLALWLYSLCEAKKVVGDTTNLVLFEESLRSAESALRSGENPITFSYVRESDGCYYFRFHLRRPKVGKFEQNACASLRVWIGEYLVIEASSPAHYTEHENPSWEDVQDALQRAIEEKPFEGAVLSSRGKLCRARPPGNSTLEQYLRGVIRDLEKLFGLVQV